ncbi:MAG: ARPP-1 family domain-containing protein, partial [bacterium]
TIQMKDILPAWTPGIAIGNRNLTLVPLRGEGHQARFQDYILASEAIDAGVLTVTEVDESGTVPELLAVNDADRPVLLIDGEELQGAKQNRILNTSVLLPPKSKTRIPVSCVEEGRWSHVSPTFKAGSYSPSSLRQRKSRDVQHSLRARGRAESDQGAVWDSVAEHIESSAAAAPTRAMSDAMATLADVLGRYHEALPYPSAACGVVAAVCGRFVALDAFDSPSTLEAIWGRLVASYAMDAEAAKDHAPKTFTAKAAGVLLEHVAEQQCQAFDAVGLGHDLRFEATDVLGQGLQADERLVHLSVFPPTIDHGTESHSDLPIQPPSARKHRLA